MNIHENFDRWMFDYMEGNLSSGEVEVFEQFLAQNPSFEPDVDAWQNTVIPTENVIYPNQHKLERKRKVAGWYGWAAAAVLITGLLFGGINLINSGDSNDTLASERATTSIDYHTNHSFFIPTETGSTVTDVQSNDVTDNQLNDYTTSLTANQNERNNAQYDSRSNNTNSRPDADINGESNALTTTQNHTSLFDEVHTVEEAMIVKGGKAIDQARDNLEGSGNVAYYANNPGLTDVELDLKPSSNLKLNAFSYKAKRFYRKVERMLGYPVGLTNLRDPRLILPENDLTNFNPAFTGGLLKPRFEMNTRAQWLGSEIAMQRSRIAFDNYRSGIRGGFGISIDAATAHSGAFGQYSINLTYSPKINLGDNLVLEPGIKLTLGMIDGRNENFGSVNAFELERGLVLNKPEAYTAGANQIWYKDWGAGFVLNAERMYVGFSADNLGGHYASVYPVEGSFEPEAAPVRYTGIIGLDFLKNNRDRSFSPFITGRHFGANTEGWAGFNARVGAFTMGGAYSTKQDFAASIGLQLKHVSLTYQYDQSTSYALNQRMGSHSLGLRIVGGKRKVRLNN